MGEAPRDGTSPIEVRDSGELPATGEAAGADFADAEGAAFVTRVDLSQLLRPAAFKAAVGLIAGMVAIAWPDRTDRIVALLVAITAIGLAVAVLIGIARHRRRPHAVDIVTIIVTVTIAALLIATSRESAAVLGRLVAAAVLVAAVRSALSARRHGVRGLAPPALAALAGLVLLSFPSQFLHLFTVMAAVGWVAASAIVLFVLLDPAARTDPEATATQIVSGWLEERPKTVDARRSLYAKILFEGPTTRSRLVRFYTLMSFATVIAAGGVIADSTAVVIGAMLVAPLMTPLMGMAISLVMGWPNRLLRSTLVALSGIGLAIGISALVGRLLPVAIHTATNSQILSRTSPTLLDLFVAIAAGAAGAYGLSRPDVSDALPGVAIAISLVPPLAVVGLTYSQGDWDAGNGALLLFATNMIAILTVGGLTFVLTGVTPLSLVAEIQHRVHTGIAAVATAAIVVIGGLFLNGATTATNLVEQSRSESSVDDWLQTSPEHQIVSVGIDGSLVAVTVAGPADGLPDVDALAATLSGEFGRQITVDVTLRVEQRMTASGTP